jgi:dynein heavy chain
VAKEGASAAWRVEALVGPLVAASVHVYNQCKRLLLPTPRKCFYSFNLRSLAAVFGGMQMASGPSIKTWENVSQLWLHETERVFGDRLCEPADCDAFRAILNDALGECMDTSWENLNGVMEASSRLRGWGRLRASMAFGGISSTETGSRPSNLVFGDFMAPGVEYADRQYKMVDNMSRMRIVVEQYLIDLNGYSGGGRQIVDAEEEEVEEGSPSSDVRMHLVLFDDVLHHIARLSRLLRQPVSGHALLVGMGGSGRRSLCRLAAFMAQGLRTFDVQRITDHAQWRADLKECLLCAGVQNRPTALFADASELSTEILNDISALLQADQGNIDIYDLYSKEEEAHMAMACRRDCYDSNAPPTMGNLKRAHAMRVRRNLHIILRIPAPTVQASSADICRNLLREHPALVQCCTVDWYAPWSKQACCTVAHHMLDYMATDLVGHVSPTASGTPTQTKSDMAQVFADIHEVAHTTSLAFYSRHRRCYHVTSAAYLDLFTVFQKMLEAKVAEMTLLRSRLQPGCDKLTEAKTMVATLQDELQTMYTDADNKAENCTEGTSGSGKLSQAVILLGHLEDEETRWKKTINDLDLDLDRICGDVAVAAATVVYAGVFDSEFRESMLESFRHSLFARGIQHTPKCDIVSFNIRSSGGNEAAAAATKSSAQLRQWHAQGLPSDHNSIENGMIMATSNRWPFCIDPQGVAGRYIRNSNDVSRESQQKGKASSSTGTGRRLSIVRYGDPTMMRTIENAIRFGGAVLLEDPGTEERLDPALSPVLEQQVFSRAGIKMIKLSSNAEPVPFENSFQLYMTTKLSNPSLLPDTCLKLCVLNFTVTRSGLAEQLLAIVLEEDSPELLVKQVELRDMQAGMHRKIAEAEDQMLQRLVSSKGSIIDDDGLVSSLLRAKETAVELMHKLDDVKCTQAQVDAASSKYAPIARQLADLYFSVAELAQVEPMYEFSLAWLSSLLRRSLRQHHQAHENFQHLGTALDGGELAQKDHAEQRLERLKETLTLIIFRNAARGIFAQHQLLFSFLFCVRRMRAESNDDESQLGSEYRWPADEFRFLVSGTNATTQDLTGAGATWDCCGETANPHPTLLTERSWVEICRLSRLPAFIGLAESIAKEGNTSARSTDAWEPGWGWAQLLDSATPLDALSECRIPRSCGGHGNEDVTSSAVWLRRLCLLRVLRPEKMRQALAAFVSQVLGHRYVLDSDRCTEQPAAGDVQKNASLNESLRELYDDSDHTTPLILLMATGADPAEASKAVQQFAQNCRGTDTVNLHCVSLGQGQGKVAERLIQQRSKTKSWVLLQNCHYGESWLGQLDNIVESLAFAEGVALEEAVDIVGATAGLGTNLAPVVHVQFRLWLQSSPTTKFPLRTLKRGVKLAFEPMLGLRAQMQRSFESLAAEQYDLGGPTRTKVYTQLVFGLVFIHAILLERKRFGPMGWNIPYAFSDSDLKSNISVLQMYLPQRRGVNDDNINIDDSTFAMLRHHIVEICYGGRTTDDKDRRVLSTVVESMFDKRLLSDERADLSPSGIYHTLGNTTSPSDAPFAAYIEYVKQLPSRAAPEVVGLHANSELVEGTAAMDKLFDIAITISAPAGRSCDIAGADLQGQEVLAILNTIASSLPPQFDVSDLEPSPGEVESLTKALANELVRFNRLLAVVKSTLVRLPLAIEGKTVMTADQEGAMSKLANNEVPQGWVRLSFLSLKPLASWHHDFLERLRFFSQWVQAAAVPAAIWFSAFFFPQGLLTGILQNFVRKEGTGYTLDKLCWNWTMTERADQIVVRPAHGGEYIHGLFLEGAKWDDGGGGGGGGGGGTLVEAAPKELYSPMPVILACPQPPIEECDNALPTTTLMYKCPVYKVQTRTGVRSTTGQSMNFIINIDIPSAIATSHWIKAGAACICSHRL